MTFFTRACSTSCCYRQFPRDHYEITRGNAAQLTWHELNTVLLGEIMANTFCSSLVRVEKHHHSKKDRERCCTQHFHHGNSICRTTFCFLHGISDHRLKQLRAHYISNGLVEWEHRPQQQTHPENGGHKVHGEVCAAVCRGYNAVLLPGRIPGYRRDDIKLLPCSTTKHHVWELYQDTASLLGLRSLSYSTFCKLWKKCLPNLIAARPLTDLCWKCQQNSTLIMRRY